MDPRLKEFVTLFNDRSFFEAHEILELLWLESKGKEKDFYKGLIQCAAAFVHHQRGNPKGAQKLYQRANGYLKSYLPRFGGINTEKLMVQVRDFFETNGDNSTDTPKIEFVKSEYRTRKSEPQK